MLFFAFSLVFYKANTLGLPLFPSEEFEVWNVEARVAFKPKEGPVKIRFALPNAPEGFVIADENFVSGKYGLAFENQNDNRIAEWAIRRANGEQVLYYQLHLARDDNQFTRHNPVIHGQQDPVYYPEIPGYSEATATIVEAFGVGVDLNKGKTLGGVMHEQFISEHPDTGFSIAGVEIPSWELILELTAQCYDLVGLGYTGVDIILDRRHGPLMLEMNARPGLSIQTANQCGLLTRLKEIEAMPSLPSDITARIALAKTLQSQPSASFN